MLAAAISDFHRSEFCNSENLIKEQGQKYLFYPTHNCHETFVSNHHDVITDVITGVSKLITAYVIVVFQTVY